MWKTLGLALLAATLGMASSASATPRATPAALTFGVQPVSSISPPQAIVVSYAAGEPLSVSLGGENATDFILDRTTCASVTIYDVCALINVRFVPSGAGPRRAFVRLDSGGTRDVALSGTGEAPVVVLQPPVGSLQPQPPQLITSEVVYLWRPGRRSTRILRLLVRSVPPGASVELRCLKPAGKVHKRLCGFKRKRVPVLRHQANAGRVLPTKDLKVGSTLELRIVKAGAIGKVVRFKIRRSRPPVTTRLCLPPGAAAPSRC